jgi:hypothetical protein
MHVLQLTSAVHIHPSSRIVERKLVATGVMFPGSADLLPLPYKDEEQVDLQMLFGSPHLPAEPIQLGALTAFVAAAVELVQLFDALIKL